MMSGAILKAWKTVKQHVPLIKFRKGGSYRETPSSSTTGSANKTEKSNVLSSKVQQLPLIEDWQLPSHYRRSALDEKEINAINSGGAY